MHDVLSSDHRQVPHGAPVPRGCLGAVIVDALQPGNEPGQPVLGEDGGCLLLMPLKANLIRVAGR